MTKAVDVRCGDDKTPRTWTEPLPALAQQFDWINNMLHYVIKRDHIVAALTRHIRDHTAEDFKPAAPGVGHCRRIGIDAGHRPTKGFHPGNEFPVPAPHIKQLPNFRGWQSEHLKGC